VKDWFRNSPFLGLGMLIAPIAVLIGFVSGGAGHGDYIAARIVLPFACQFIGSYLGAAVVVSALAFLQWPLYGLLVDKTSHKSRALVSVLAIHTALCFWLFTKGSENFQ
jgi:hypothetical protein